jgi:hypothetical protein
VPVEITAVELGLRGMEWISLAGGEESWAESTFSELCTGSYTRTIIVLHFDSPTTMIFGDRGLDMSKHMCQM